MYTKIKEWRLGVYGKNDPLLKNKNNISELKIKII
jgi:hypothetical protein